MNVGLSVTSAMGGVVVFIGAVIAVVRAVFKLVQATQDNTYCLRELTGKVDSLSMRANGYGERIAALEGRDGRGWRQDIHALYPPRVRGHRGTVVGGHDPVPGAGGRRVAVAVLQCQPRNPPEHLRWVLVPGAQAHSPA